MKNIKTVRISANGFFSINAGIEIETALQEASLFLGIARDEATPNEAWTSAYMIDLAKGLIDSVLETLTDDEAASKDKTTDTPFFPTHTREDEYLFSANAGVDIYAALQRALLLLTEALPDAKASDAWAALALLEMAKAIVESAAKALKDDELYKATASVRKVLKDEEQYKSYAKGGGDHE